MIQFCIKELFTYYPDFTLKGSLNFLHAGF